MSRMVLMGAVAGAFGVRGEVRIRSFADRPEDVFAYGPLCHEDGRTALSVDGWRPVPDGFAARCREVADREAAMALRNTRLFVPRARLPQTDEDEFYHVDLIGLAVEALDGAPLGRVHHVLAGPQDLLEITGTPGARRRWFLPLTRALVPVVDLKGGRLVADVPDGLIDPADARPMPEPGFSQPLQTEAEEPGAGIREENP
jgi:16S rRNA processing protein RimM